MLNITTATTLPCHAISSHEVPHPLDPHAHHRDIDPKGLPNFSQIISSTCLNEALCSITRERVVE